MQKGWMCSVGGSPRRGRTKGAHKKGCENGRRPTLRHGRGLSVMILPQVHLRNRLHSPTFPLGLDYISSRARWRPTHLRLVCERSPTRRVKGLRCGSSISPGQAPRVIPSAVTRTPMVSHGPPDRFPHWFGVKGVRRSPSIRKASPAARADLHADVFRVAQPLFPAAFQGSRAANAERSTLLRLLLPLNDRV